MKFKSTKQFVFFLLFILFSEGILLSQNTAGTFTLNLNTSSTGGYSPKHLIAIWIENSSTNYVKTRLLECSPDNYDHLDNWATKYGSNSDAVSGSTLTTHGKLTITWNGTNVSGTIVPDGIYRVWVEMAWDDSYTTGKTTTSFAFTKGTSVANYTPANLANFTSITYSWTPNIPTAIEKIADASNVIVFPNPATDIINLKFRNDHTPDNIRIFNDSGVLVYNELLPYLSGTEKKIDISNLQPGAYFVYIHFDSGDEIARVIKTK